MTSQRFQVRKDQILAQLDMPETEYRDLSPKGSIDGPILPLIKAINGVDGLVTTSSCSGRISAFLDGPKVKATRDNAEDQAAGRGGKGGGSWLFVSHDPVALPNDLAPSHFLSTFGLEHEEVADQSPNASSRYIHLKFEPAILHVLTASLEHAQNVLAAALAAGFRESGAVSLAATTQGECNPTVAVRSAGYSFDCIIGYRDSYGNNIALVNESYLRVLIDLANARFTINTERIGRFEMSLKRRYGFHSASTAHDEPDGSWEDATVRRLRKRQEGLARQQALQDSITCGHEIVVTDIGYFDIDDQDLNADYS